MRAPPLWFWLRLLCGLGVALGGALGTAWAFDIPTPQNQPQTVGTTSFGTPQPFAPVHPLAPTTALDSTDGAGQLPQGVSVRTEITVPPQGLLQRAPFLVTLTVIDRTKNIASLTLHRPFGARITTRRISISQGLETVDGRLANVRVYRFAVTALSGGIIPLEFAEMTFQMVGEPTSNDAFIPVARSLSVRPLPAFWPESIPVTPPLRLVQMPLPPLYAGEPVDWQLRVTGRGLTEHALAEMLDEQLIGSEALALGAAEVRLSPNDPVPADDPLAQTFDIRIPLLPAPESQNATSGELPALRLPYINSHEEEPGAALSAAKLPTQTLNWQPTARAQLLQAAAFWGWRLALALVALYALGFALRDGSRRVAQRRRHSAAQRRLAQCPSPQAALDVLRALTGEATTQGMMARAPNPCFMAALHSLDAACFAAAPPANHALDWHTTQAELVRWLPLVFFSQDVGGRRVARNRP